MGTLKGSHSHVHSQQDLVAVTSAFRDGSCSFDPGQLTWKLSISCSPVECSASLMATATSGGLFVPGTELAMGLDTLMRVFLLGFWLPRRLSKEIQNACLPLFLGAGVTGILSHARVVFCSLWIQTQSSLPSPKPPPRLSVGDC